MRKKIFLLVLVCFLFSFVLNENVYGAIPAPPTAPTVPIITVSPIGMSGVSCGNSEGQTPAEKACCQPQNSTNTLAGLIDQAKNLPVIGWFITPFAMVIDAATMTQRSISTIPCVFGSPSTPDPTNPACTCLQSDQITPSPIDALVVLCNKYMAGSSELGACVGCAKSGKVYTGVICADTQFNNFIQNTVFGFGIGLAGILALLCIIYSAFSLETSRGNPEKIKKAQEMLTSCIIGLMFIIFSVFILRVIGVNILKIPGFK